MNKEVIQSAGGIIYFVDEHDTTRFLIIKRQAKTKKIERVAPKGKVKPGEDQKQTALREVCEETGLPINNLIIGEKVGTVELRQEDAKFAVAFEKDMSFFLMRYIGDPDMVNILDGEGYTGQHKRATIEDVSNLIYFPNMRTIFLNAFNIIKKKVKNNSVKEAFLRKI